MKLVPPSGHSFLGIPYSVNIILTVLTRLFADNLSASDDRKFAVVVYNIQIILIIEMEYICTTTSHGLSVMLWGMILFFGVSAEIQDT